MKVSKTKNKYLLIVAVILVQMFVSGFGIIPITGFSTQQSDVLIDLAQSNPEIGQSLIDPTTFQSNTELQTFIDTVADGTAGVVRGIYVEDQFEFPVIQQPSGQPGYVSSQSNVVTEFAMAKQNGVTGILAHNYLAGADFFNLQDGDVIQVVYGDGLIQQYEIIEVLEYQALSPNSPTSAFIDLETDEQLSATQLFNRVYTGSHHLTMQTCIQVGSEDSWGRLFLIAEPIV
jgi:hypothetical protein